MNSTVTLLLNILLCSLVQLDLRSKMARIFTWTSAGNILWFPLPLCMDNCHFSSCSAYFVGMLVDHDTRTGYNWFSCNNGWHCSSFGILFCNALVENTVAKFKYVLC